MLVLRYSAYAPSINIRSSMFFPEARFNKIWQAEGLCWRETLPVLRELFELPRDTEILRMRIEVRTKRTTQSQPVRLAITADDSEFHMGKIYTPAGYSQHPRLTTACRCLTRQYNIDQFRLVVRYQRDPTGGRSCDMTLATHVCKARIKALETQQPWLRAQPVKTHKERKTP
jgi:hypothetical protein